ncbi:GDSL-type esterase/lipase family protein [Neobacillus ginsengisoli]|uniref:Lysophospholipase L1-like esterase n=1 Tax=Neobacillus ginsengisoli TaxID=904295 RepID=A0ABT9XX39_9BACI|nr:GDSL-type esterase/lipase family protein [Neobacillus ginsengisoli]MDQ0200140.1 lysophospholipase L1-like esterase [Neobacillus ginsengisoli]
MKIFKYMIVFVVIIAFGVSAWIYYPQYQINKMKKQADSVNTYASKVSYINYFRNSKEPQIYHLGLGDSVIRGVGARQNEDLVFQFSNKLEIKIHKKVVFQNEGINGITSSELKSLVQQGRFDEEIKKADIVTINVGGNDILRVAKGWNFHNVFQTFDQLQSTFSNNLKVISARINDLNPKATIVFLALYNPLSPSNQMYSLSNKLLPNWNLKIYEVANHSPSSIVVETTSVINGDNPQNLSSDGVHPNSAGYSAISEQMIYQFKHQNRKTSI